jgi:hypothetical protein
MKESSALRAFIEFGKVKVESCVSMFGWNAPNQVTATIGFRKKLVVQIVLSGKSIALAFAR